jgi:parallel beta-helix repeat protein
VTVASLSLVGSGSATADPGVFSVTTTGDSGPGSLRAAIDSANAAAGPDAIVFAIPVTASGFNGQWFTIRPITQLPALTDDGTTIDGSTQTASTGDTNPAGPEIELNGGLAPVGTDGLVISSSNDTINGLVVNGFKGVPAGGNGIIVSGSGTIVTGSFIGLDATGSSAVGNENNGVSLTGAGIGNRVGGTTAAERNVISGNAIDGVQIHLHGNVVQGNFIGTDATGTKAIANRLEGVGLVLGAGDNVVGGLSPGAGNVISGNEFDGVFIGSNGGANANTVEGNRIGTDVTGTAALGNRQDGIRIVSDVNFRADGNTIRTNLIAHNAVHGVGLFSSDDNVIQGNRVEQNGSHGVSVGGGPAGPASSGNLIGGTGPDDANVVSGNVEIGVFITGGSSNNLVQGNFVGTDATGNSPFGNQIGVQVTGDPGTSAEDNRVVGNTLSGNREFGVFVGQFESGTKVQRNRIGTNASGTAAVGNGVGSPDCCAGGVRIGDGAMDVTVGGPSPSERNVISGNDEVGVGVIGSTRILVQGNFIGTNADGTAAIPNARTREAGVRFFTRVTNSSIRGNLISGNGRDGVSFSAAPGESTRGNTIEGNRIGTNAGGNAALPNGGFGIFFTSGGVSKNTIGGTTAATRNVVSGNGGSGILLFDHTSANTVRGNYVGLDKGGVAPVGNGSDGITIEGASDNVLAANQIAFNAFEGIGVFADFAPALRNRASRNVLFSNGALGIDLGGDGVTPNDPGDADTGPNALQNFPVLSQATARPDRLVVQGRIDTPNPTTVTIELFANRVPSPGGDPSGHGEGAAFLGTAKPSAQGRFTAALPAVPPGTLITATAIDASGNTSEFAANVPAKP